ncbi:inorganic diphosphatase [Buchnera aphidicola]|uniref:inorganic diphosphatase n=1 Tax=Buchnera aphidicola TaxID=9 RepID=UPI0030ECCD4C
MNLKNKFYKNFYVKIEISANSDPIKYEIHKNNLIVDRFIPTSMHYPCNYGYIKKTLSLDKDPLDALVITPYPLAPLSIIKCRTIGILNMEDESGIDFKILCVPHKSISEEYNFIKNISDISEIVLKKITHFFKYYKNLENNKWSKVKNWGNKKKSQKIIENSYKKYLKKKKN